ncbi:MAG: hypothetical protein ACYTFG_02620 [Planctomycetota bacterium]|jgi:hypothetical protein
MDRHDGKIRDGLLAQVKTPGAGQDRYRKEVRNMIEEKEKRLKRERIVTSGMWIFIVLLSTAFLLIAGHREGDDRLWFGIQACFWFFFGAVFLIKYFLNRNRVEFLKEIKGIEMRIMDLQDRAAERGE